MNIEVGNMTQVASFFKNSKSSVLIIFALALPSIMLTVTYVVDASNIVYNSLVLQTSVDAASLAGIRARFVSGSNAQGTTRATLLYGANRAGLQYPAATPVYVHTNPPFPAPVAARDLTVTNQQTVSLWFRALWSAIPVIRVTSVARATGSTNSILFQ